MLLLEEENELPPVMGFIIVNRKFTASSFLWVVASDIQHESPESANVVS